MKDLSERSPETVSSTKEKYYPTFTLPVDTLPGLEGKKVGAEIMLKVKAEVTSISQYRNGETEVRIELKQGEIIEDKKE